MKENRLVLPLFFLVTTIFFTMHADQFDQLDVMSDFAYPRSNVENARYDLTQALYFLQKQDVVTSTSFLHKAVSNLQIRTKVSDDDREFIEKMIEQIDALIAALEKDQDRSNLVDILDQIHKQL